MHTGFSCARGSAAADEPIAATATAEMTQWLIIESSDPWPRTGLPAPMRADLRAAAERAVAAVPGTRLLLARGEHAVGSEGPRIWIVRAGPTERMARQIHLAPPHSAQDLDLEARLRGVRRDGAAVEQLLLVCTHGQRDRCCAREGMPIYQALREVAPNATFRASHLGGHRFAPTVLALPLGAHFGRVRRDDAAALVAAVARGERGPARWYRGRTFLSRPAQAAICHLHDVLGEPRLDALELIGVTSQGDDHAMVRVRHGEREHRVAVVRRPHTAPLVKSCGEAPVGVPGWRVAPG